MRNIRSTNTRPERIIMDELRKRKIYFAKHAAKILGKPDIVFRRKKVLVFVDSDFWHGHPERFQMPKTNAEYWEKKIKNNKKRDKQITHELIKQGWTVIRLWDYDIKHNLTSCVNIILKKIGREELINNFDK